MILSAWEVEYELEAANYLADNGELVTDLFFAMGALAQTEGIPPDGTLSLSDGLLAAILEQHIVIYRRDEANRIISIIIIKPPG